MVLIVWSIRHALWDSVHSHRVVVLLSACKIADMLGSYVDYVQLDVEQLMLFGEMKLPFLAFLFLS